jgi:His-Xaa-Ser system radical SAM maturase HxsC
MPPLKLHTKAKAIGITKRIVAKITNTPIVDRREDYFLIVDEVISDIDCNGYAGILTKQEPELGKLSTPWIGGFDDMELLKSGYIISVEQNGFTHVIYRPDSHHNTLFATGRCNNNCIMCPQPPTNSADSGWVESHLRFIDLINDDSETLCITGGEPTLLGDDLISILKKASTCLPTTSLYMLTNGRQFADDAYVQKIGAIPQLKLLCGIPLYADVAPLHDYIVQAKGAFEQTVKGLYNMARHQLPVEIRVVLHKQTIPRLLSLVEFIYRNFPFVSHVALMGLENMGYVKNNWELLWIDPVDYQDELEIAVRYLHYRQMSVSIFNLQLCVLKSTLYPFARKSISDFKNIFLEECNHCAARNSCAGLFKSSETRHSRGVKALTSPILI